MEAYIPSKKVSEKIIQFYRQCSKLTLQQWNIRENLRKIDLAYYRENDFTEEQWKAKMANMRGDSTKFQNVVVPMVMPQVESAVTYQQSVFLSGFPIFGATSSPEYAQAAEHMDAVIADEQVNANWVPEFLKSLRCGFKYNFGPTEVSWATEKSYALEEPTDTESASAPLQQTEVVWAGNRVKSLDPYNTFWDTRVSMADVPKKAEFAGYTELVSRIYLKQLISEMPRAINPREAFESGFSGGGPAAGKGSIGDSYANYYIPSINPESLYKVDRFASTNWLAWAGLENGKSGHKIDYKDMYEITYLYGRILPSDFGMAGIPSPNTPQIWKFIIVNGQALLGAERQTNAHNLIPIFFCCPNDDNLSYQTKSLAKNIEPFQQINTALSNSIIAARRREIADRILYDPSRIAESAIRSDAPVARIPVRPSAFGNNIGEAVYQLPFVDNQSQHSMQAIQSFSTLANQASGLNPARQGQFVRGNKTRAEFEEIMGYANGRDQTVALTLEGNFFSPIKKVIKTNILQFQGGTELFDRVGQQIITVDPVELRKAKLEFKLSDGLNPSDKIVDGESLSMAFQTLSQMPELAAGYNLAPMFSYLMTMRGAKLSGFEKSQEQIAYEQAVAAWQQTVLQVMESLQATYGEQLPSPEQLQAMLPPQPLPEQFGYTPGQVTPAVQHQGTSVMERFSQVTQGIQESRAQAGQQAQQAQETGI